MNGTNYLLDTNAIIALLNGNTSLQFIVTQANWLGVSVISIVEFLSFSNLTSNDKNIFTVFLQRVSIINLSYQANIDIINLASTIRITHKLKLPDALVAASAQLSNCVLVTNDKQFATIPSLKILTF